MTDFETKKVLAALAANWQAEMEGFLYLHRTR
jgi:hypothetical protein